MAPAPTVVITSVNYQTGVITYTSNIPYTGALLRVNTTAIAFFDLLAGDGNTATFNDLKAIMYGGITANGNTVQVLTNPTNPVSNTYTMVIPSNPVATLCKVNQQTGALIYNAQSAETVYVYVNGTQLTPSFITVPGILQTIIFDDELIALPYGGTLTNGDEIVLKTAALVAVSNTIVVEAPPLLCASLLSVDLELGRLTFTPAANITAFLSIDNGAPEGNAIYTGTLATKAITSSLLVSSTYGGPLSAGSTYTIRLKTTALETVSDVLTVEVPVNPSATITDLNTLTGTVSYSSTAEIKAYITVNGVRSLCPFTTIIGSTTQQDDALISYLEGGTLQNGDIISFTTAAGVTISDSYTVVLPTATITEVNTSSGLVSFSTTAPMSFFLYKNGVRIGSKITATSGSQSFTNSELLSYLYGGTVISGDYITFGTASGTMITPPFNITVDNTPITITDLDYNTGILSYTASEPAKVYLYINGVKQPTLFTLPAGSSTISSAALIASIYNGSLANGDQITLATDIGYVLSIPNPYTASFPTSPTATISDLDQFTGLLAYAAPTAAVVVKVLKNGTPIGAKFTLTPPSGSQASVLYKSVTYGGPLVNADKLLLALDVSNIPISPEFTVVVPTSPFITITAIDYNTGDMTFDSAYPFTAYVAINGIPVGATEAFAGSVSPQTVNRVQLKSVANGGSLNNGDLVSFVIPDAPFTALSNEFTAAIGTDVTLLDLNEETGELTYNATGTYSVTLYLNGSASLLTFTTTAPSGSFTDIALVSQLYGGALANNTTLQTYDTSPAPNSNTITSFVPSIPCVTITAIDFTTGEVSYDAILPGSSTINAIMRLEGTSKGTAFTLSNGSGQTLTVAALKSIYYGGEAQNTDEIVMAATTTAGVSGTGQIISNTFSVSVSAPITISSVDIVSGTATYTTTFTDSVEIYINDTATGIIFTPSTTPSSTITDNLLKGTIYGGSVGNSHPVEFRKPGPPVIPFSTIIYPIVPSANTTITITAIDYTNGILYYTSTATTYVSVYINGTSYGSYFYANAGTENVTRTQLKASQFGGLLVSGDQVRLGTSVPIYMSNTFTAAPPNPIAITISNVNQATGDLTYTSTDSGFNASPYVDNVTTGQVFTVQSSQTYPFGSTLVTTLNGGAVTAGAKITIKNTLGVLISNEYTITFPILPVATINYFRGTDGTFGYTSTAAIKAKIYINGSDTGASTITLAANSPGTSYITASQLKTNLYGGPIANEDDLSLKTLDGVDNITTADYEITVPIPEFVTITALDLANGILSYTSTAEAEAFLQINGVTIPGTSVQSILTSPPTRTITNTYLAAVANGGAITTGSTIRFYTGYEVISNTYSAIVPIVINIKSVNFQNGVVTYTCTSTVSVFPAINGVKITGVPYPISISDTVIQATVTIPEFIGLAIGDYITFVDAADTTVSTTYYAYWLQYDSGNNPSAVPPITENELVSDTQVNLCGTNIQFSSRQLFGAVDNFTFSFTLPNSAPLQTTGNVLDIGLYVVNTSINMGTFRLIVSPTSLTGYATVEGFTSAYLYNTFGNLLGNTVSVNYIKAGDTTYNNLYDIIVIKNESMSQQIFATMSLLSGNEYGTPGTPPLNGQKVAPYSIKINGSIGYAPPGANKLYSITNMTRKVYEYPSLIGPYDIYVPLYNNQKTAYSPFGVNMNNDPWNLTLIKTYDNFIFGSSGMPFYLNNGTLYLNNTVSFPGSGDLFFRIMTQFEKTYVTSIQFEYDSLQANPCCGAYGMLYGPSKLAYWRVDPRIGYPTWRSTLKPSTSGGAIYKEMILDSNENLFGLVENNGIAQFSTSSGSAIWQTTFTGSPITLSPMIMTSDEAYIYVFGKTSVGTIYLYKIQASDGSEISRTTVTAINNFNFTYGKISFDGTKFYLPCSSRLVALTATTGAEAWHYDIPGGFEVVVAAPAIGSTGNIFIGSRDGSVSAINSSGSLLWTTPSLNMYNQQLIVAQTGVGDGITYEDYVYCPGDYPNISLTVLKASNGSSEYSYSFTSPENTIGGITITGDGGIVVVTNKYINIFYVV